MKKNNFTLLKMPSKQILFYIGFIIFCSSCISPKKCNQQKMQEAARIEGIWKEKLANCEAERGRERDDIKSQLKAATEQNKLASDKYNTLLNELTDTKSQLAKCLGKTDGTNEYVSGLKLTIDEQKERLTKAESDLNKTQQSIDLLKDANRDLINDVTIKRLRDSLVKNVYENLVKGLDIDNTNQDITVKVDKAVVYVEISEKVLFKSGSFDLSPNANASLSQIVKVIQNKPNFDVIVEGHTDNVAYSSGILVDNWDLSAKRATSVARLLQKSYNVNPSRLSASARSEFKPLVENSSPENRGKNRRIKIIITPTLEQFGKLLEQATTN